MERGSGAATWTVSGQRGEVRGQWHPWSHLFGTYRFDQNSQHHVNAGKYRNRYSCSCVATTRIFLFFPPSPRSVHRFREDFEISFPVTTRISLSCQLFFKLARPTRRQSEMSNRSRIDDHGLLVRSIDELHWELDSVHWIPTFSYLLLEIRTKCLSTRSRFETIEANPSRMGIISTKLSFGMERQEDFFEYPRPTRR